MEVGVNMHACVCISTCDCFHLRVQVCECECVCAQAEARSPPGTRDHTQHSNIWQQICGAAANKWACSAGSPPPDPPTERGERLAYCMTAYNLPSFVLFSWADSLTFADKVTEQGMPILMLCVLLFRPVFYRRLNFRFSFFSYIFNSFLLLLLTGILIYLKIIF